MVEASENARRVLLFPQSRARALAPPSAPPTLSILTYWPES